MESKQNCLCNSKCPNIGANIYTQVWRLHCRPCLFLILFSTYFHFEDLFQGASSTSAWLLPFAKRHSIMYMLLYVYSVILLVTDTGWPPFSHSRPNSAALDENFSKSKSRSGVTSFQIVLQNVCTIRLCICSPLYH